MEFLIIFAGWVCPGIVAFGLLNAFYRKHFPDEYRPEDLTDFIIGKVSIFDLISFAMLIMFGPFALLITCGILLSGVNGTKYSGFTLKVGPIIDKRPYKRQKKGQKKS
jgi:uncharacterized membrane protein